MCSQIALLEDLDSAIERAKALVFVVPDDTGFFTVENQLVQQVQGIIEEALDLMRRVMDFYDRESGSDISPDLPLPTARQGEDDFLREIGAAISSELAAQEVSNIAFAVRTQLLETYDALRAALGRDQVWVIASHADTGLRRAGKGLIMLESTVREYEGLEPVERSWSKLHDSLEIRRLYCQFRRGILRQGAPGDLDALTTTLRRAAHRIAILRDRRIYPLMRISDRLPIRRLQKRILTWLKAEPTTDREEQGRRLWGDLVSFAELLIQVNHREELREHDRQVVREWLDTHFPEPASDDRVSRPETHPSPLERPAERDHLADLEPLIGCSEELDELLLRPDRRTLEELRTPLQNIFQRLNRPYEGVEEPLGSPL